MLPPQAAAPTKIAPASANGSPVDADSNNNNNSHAAAEQPTSSASVDLDWWNSLKEDFSQQDAPAESQDWRNSLKEELNQLSTSTSADEPTTEKPIAGIDGGSGSDWWDDLKSQLEPTDTAKV